MKALLSSGLLALSLSGTASALIGYGIPMYQPNCAFACRDQFSMAMLSCSSMDHSAGMDHHGPGATTPECYASNTPFLTTLAYCINATCTDIPKFRLEAYWAERATKNERGNKLEPKWSYQETLFQMSSMPAPNKTLEKEEILDFTALYDPEAWEASRGAMHYFELSEMTHSKYGIVILVVSFATPIFITCLAYLPFMSLVADKIRPRLVWPALIGMYHVRALPFTLGNAPTLGQTGYIALFIILNIIATAAGYHSYQHPSNAWFPTRWEEIMTYVAARTGVLALALAPLTILFAGRNNILLWLSNWSHSTYLLLHRWVARMFTLHVVLHSILFLMLYQRQGKAGPVQKEPWWIWGIIGTLASSIMVVCAALWFRRKSYEVFLIVHIVLAVFVVAGSWYHIELRFERHWGYEIWLYAACGVWFFDRVIRVGRILKNGMLRADLTEVADGLVRIDIKGVRWRSIPGRHTYAYFPTLNSLKPWENHPFSVIPTALLRSQGHSVAVSSSSSGSQHSAEDIEKSGATTARVASVSHSVQTDIMAGISLYVRKSTGMTKILNNSSNLLALLDGPYPNNSTKGVLSTDRLVLVAGGIGITATLPFVAHHPNVKLYWSVKSGHQGLVADLSNVLDGLREKDVKVGSRLDVASLLEAEEKEGWKRIGVVVCGPGGLCDDARSLVAKKARSSKAVWELDVEAFSW